jgi:hypothetical protein
MPELSGRELLGEWRNAMDAVTSSAASVAGHAPVPHQLIEPMQRQLELVEEIVERERRLQRDLTARVVAPVDAVFDLLEESAVTLQAQAEAVEAAGKALADTAVLMRRQAGLLERAVAGLREPAELAKAAAGLDRKPRRPQT